MNEKGRQTKLLAAIAILAMVVCVFAIVMPSADAAETHEVKTVQELQQALESASDGDIIDIAAGTYGNNTNETGYTVYTVDKAVTITSSAVTKPTIYGSFWVIVDGVTINNLNINPYGNMTGDTNSTNKNGISFYGDKITVTNCEFTVRNAEGAFANGIAIFPKTDNAANWNITGNTFNGFFKSSGNWTTTSISVANEFSTARFGSSINTADAEMTDDELIAIVNANIFNGNAYSLSYTNYGNTDATIVSATYILDDGFYCGQNVSTYILAGTTIDKTSATTGGDGAISVNGVLYNYGTLNANTVTNNGIIYNAGTISVTPSGGTVIDATNTENATTEVSGTITEENVIEIFDAGADIVTVTSGSVSIPDSISGTLVIGASVALNNGKSSDDAIVVGENSVIVAKNFQGTGSSFYFKNSTSGAAVQLSDFVGTDVTVSYGSIVIGGTGISGTINVGAGMELELTSVAVNDGASTFTVNLGNGSTLTINDNVEVPASSTLAVKTTTPASDKAVANLSRNMTFTINGNISVGQGVTMDLSDGVLNGNGKITLTSESTLIYTAGTLGNVQIDNVAGGTVEIENGFGIENTVRTDLVLEGTDNYLANDITIEEGVTLTITRNAALDLRGFDLTIKGTLVIEKNGTIVSSVNGGKLLLTSTGAIQNNNGIIGSEYPITIGNGEKLENGEPTQTVTMQGVSGVSIQLVRNSDRTYNMYVSGDVSRISGVDIHTLTLDDVGINADMTIGSGVVFNVNGNTVVSKDVTFTHNGIYMAVSGSGSFVLTNGTVAVFNSPVNGNISANTGVIISGNQEPAIGATFNLAGATTGTAPTYSGVTGITISVDRVTYPDPNTSGKSIVEQRSYVTGTLNFENTSSTDNVKYANAMFTGTIYVVDTLSIPEDVGITGIFDVSDNGMIVTSEKDAGVIREVTYTGASYIIESVVNNATTETTYYTNFAAAMEQIASAMEQQVTVSGEFEISGTYELTGEQSITYVDGAKVTVAEDGQITVGTDADINNLAFWEINGRVIVTEGVGYRPAATYQGDANQYIYAVKTIEEETNTTTYSGFAIAIDNANPGETITVVGDATYDGNLVIPAQVTVDMNPEITLTVYGNVTVEAEGKLILDNGSDLMVGKSGNRDYTITVNGIIDASDGGDIGKNATTGSVDLYSTGSVIIDSTVATLTGIDVNAAYYSSDNTVYTSVANAVAFAQEDGLTAIYATGTFSESGAVTSDGVNIVIQNNADVTLGDVTLDGATISVAPVADTAAEGTKLGVYTANVSGLSGEGDAASTSTVSVNKSSATVASVETLNAEGVSQYRLTIDRIDASATVSAGTVEFVGTNDNSDINTSRDLTITIESGATLLFTDEASISGEYIVNNGTIAVDDGANLTVSGTVPGTVSVLEGGEMTVTDNATFTGDVVVDADGTFAVNGILFVGESPEILGETTTGSISGEVDLGDSAVVYAYNGTDVSGAEFQNASGQINSTAYSINKIALVTVYTFDQVDIDSNAITDIVYGLKDLATGADTTTTEDDLNITWYSGETPITTQTVGQYAEVTTEIRYNTVGVIISVPGQITLSIDNVIVNGSQPLTIGTHTVSAVVDPGYSGIVTITFNGQTVANGGTIEITSEMLTQLDAPVLSVTGELTQDQPVINVPGSSSDDNGMGLTDYLLIILVILIVIMAIMVAARLMRS